MFSETHKGKLNYKEIYKNYFGYVDDEFVPSELSGRSAQDLHHVHFKSGGRDDSIENLMALTREEHDKAHRRELTEEYLKQKHLEYIKRFNFKK